MPICELLFQWASTIKIQLSRPHYHLIENYLFLPWYSWKIAELVLNNNHSLTQSNCKKLLLQVIRLLPDLFGYLQSQVFHWSPWYYHIHVVVYVDASKLYSTPDPRLWVWISIRARCTTLCNKVYQWLATGRWFSQGPLVSSTNKTDSWYNWNIVESGIKHHQTNKLTQRVMSAIAINWHSSPVHP